MAFSDEEIQEFQTEARELLDAAEEALLALDSGAKFETSYDSIFRVFHSLKGAAGMMEISTLQGHMHHLENILTGTRSNGLTKAGIDFFLRGTDVARRMLRGESTEFEYNFPSNSSPTPAPPPAPEPEAKVKTAVTAAATETTKIGRVLVVDDEPELTQMLTEILEASGFETFGFTSSTEALSQIKELNPDAVVSDISMPNLDGTELLRLIRTFAPDLPVIFVSGHVTKDVLIKAIEHDVFGIIEKPFKVVQIIELCANACKRHRLAKLLNHSINLIMFQYNEIDAYLKEKNKEDARNTLRSEIQALVRQRRELRQLRKN